jgi:hypothetical protein
MSVSFEFAQSLRYVFRIARYNRLSSAGTTKAYPTAPAGEIYRGGRSAYILIIEMAG